VQDVIKEFSSEELIRLEETEAVLMLAEAYLAALVVPFRYEDDVLHIAYATFYQADFVVSWNFRHMVNIIRIEAFNAINTREGYGKIDIRSPKELIYGKEKEGF
jgi:hypothetical protein